MGHGLPPRIGPYRPTQPLAQGGMARVVVATHAEGGGDFAQRVALKLIRPELADDAAYVTMFLDECRINSRVSHPNVVRVLELGRDPRTQILYMAMELVLGVTLSRLIGRARLPTGMALEVLAQAADGLHAAHVATAEDGTPLALVHRDISPPNILVGLDGVVRIGDFGVARAAQRLTKTRTGQFKGKLDYCSPEQAMGEPLDARSDLFSLGIVAFELMSRKRLFRGDTPFETLERIMHRPIPDLGRVRKDLPPQAVHALTACLARRREDRPPSAAALAKSLRAAAASAGLPKEIEGLRWAVAAVAPPEIRALAGVTMTFAETTLTGEEDAPPAEDATVVDRGDR